MEANIHHHLRLGEPIREPMLSALLYGYRTPRCLLLAPEASWAVSRDHGVLESNDPNRRKHDSGSQSGVAPRKGCFPHPIPRIVSTAITRISAYIMNRGFGFLLRDRPNNRIKFPMSLSLLKSSDLWWSLAMMV